jgi:hypothetical protein
MTLKSKYIGLIHVYIEIPFVVVQFVRLMSLSKIYLNTTIVWKGVWTVCVCLGVGLWDLLPIGPSDYRTVISKQMTSTINLYFRMFQWCLFSIPNIKVDSRWILFVKNWISNFTVVQWIKIHNIATIMSFWTKIATVTNVYRTVISKQMTSTINLYFRMFQWCLFSIPRMLPNYCCIQINLRQWH